VEADRVKEVEVIKNEVHGVLKDGTRFETILPESQKHWDLLREHKVQVAVSSASSQSAFWYFVVLVTGIIMLFAVWYFMRLRAANASNGGGNNNIFSMGKSRAKMVLPSAIKDTFASVAGAANAKEELQDLVDFLKNPDKYKRLGAKITRGVLLVGAPGNGKTLLARAVAGEANVPFFSVSGSDFIEVFVGVGAARVRDLFAQARAHAPAIIFIDEIDAVGRQRGTGVGGGHDEREQTLNQLLTEMDGFATSEVPVIVIAATNRGDVLDKALLRPGRFDRIVEVPYPDLASREQILRVHAKDLKIDPAIDLARLAKGTPGFTGAALAGLLNEAAIIASKKNRAMIVLDDIEEARDKVIVGRTWKTAAPSDFERKVTAYHEAGHAIVQVMLPPEDVDPLYKVSILPRGSSLGHTAWLPQRDKFLTRKEELLGAVMAALGGRIGEELAFNTSTAGAASDFSKASDMVRRMICHMGMSESLGTVIYDEANTGYSYSQDTAQRIDEEVRNLMAKCYEQAKNIIVSNRDKWEKLAQELLEKESLTGSQVYELLDIKPHHDHSLGTVPVPDEQSPEQSITE
jgi:cell division protease FtsH